MHGTGLVWFRKDLRLNDNPALARALSEHETVRALYIHEESSGVRRPGAAARWWLHHSLNCLAKDLAKIGVPLETHSGESMAILSEHLASCDASAIYWNRRYGPAERELDATIKSALRGAGLRTESFNASLLVDPWEIETGKGTPFAVFTPFYKTLRRQSIAAPVRLESSRSSISPSPVDDSYPTPDWAGKLESRWQIGESAAGERLRQFIDEGLVQYAERRDIPATPGTSGLSPHLRFGEIGPRQVWHAIRYAMDYNSAQAEPGEKFLAELGWREFCHHLLYHRKDIVEVQIQSRYDTIAWRSDPSGLEAWQRGKTGIPIVDAGMRELWATGTMHNRVRMIVASFLTKNLLIDWRDGERWFWDTLVDADPANNPANWQWVAGVGADAAPYFRVFNPLSQAKRFDPEGEYIRKWVPELHNLPVPRLFAPWEATDEQLTEVGIAFGTDYPRPIVDLKMSRQRAIDVFAAAR